MKRIALRNDMLLMERACWRWCLAICFACWFALLAVQPAWAAEFEVDTELDGVDSDLNDGVCLNVTVVAGGTCTLRAAIQQANFTPNVPDTINLPPGLYTLTLENQLNNAEDAAESGDLDITSNIVINGAGADVTIVEAGEGLHDRVFHLVGEEAVAALNQLTVRNGNTTELLGNQDGGGILVGGGILDGFELAVSNNTSGRFGGGILYIGVNSSSLNRCTINGNKAIETNGRGGGLFHGQNYFLNVTNCTISDNEASSRGGGVDVSNNSKLIVINNSTIANNRLVDDPEEGAGIYMGNNTDIHIFNSIVADNIAQGNVENDCYGQFDIMDHTLVEVPAPGACILAGDGESVDSLLGADDPLLGPLAENGGALQTHALLDGSIAIDAGNQLLPDGEGRACADNDARGESRPGGLFCDMGSFEVVGDTLFMPKLEK